MRERRKNGALEGDGAVGREDMTGNMLDMVTENGSEFGGYQKFQGYSELEENGTFDGCYAIF